MRPPLMFLPRLARALHHPALAAALGAIIIVVALIGIATGDMPTGWAILIIVVGIVNVLRAVVGGDAATGDAADAEGASQRDS